MEAIFIIIFGLIVVGIPFLGLMKIIMPYVQASKEAKQFQEYNIQELLKENKIAHTKGIDMALSIIADEISQLTNTEVSSATLARNCRELSHSTFATTNDSAIHAGVASAIGGPLAGIAAAARIEAENEESRRINETNRQMYRDLSLLMEYKAIDDNKEKQQKIDFLTAQSQYVLNNYSAVYDNSPLTLMSRLSINSICISNGNSEITANIKMRPSPSRKPKYLPICGAIRIKGYINGTFFTSANLMLPYNGCSEYEKKINGTIPVFTSYLNMPPISFKVEPIDLWELSPKSSNKKFQSRTSNQNDHLTESDHQSICDTIEREFKQECLNGNSSFWKEYYLGKYND